METFCIRYSESFGKIKSGTWGQLMSNDTNVRRVRQVVENGLLAKVGDGKSTLFWHDKWVLSKPIKLSFPRLFSIFEQGNIVISEMGE